MSSQDYPRQFDIFSVKADWGEANYPHPCVILDSSNPAKIKVVFISSKYNLHSGTAFYDSMNFEIPADHPDFPATGLEVTSFIDGGEIHPDIDPKQIGRKRIGRLTGSLLAEFRQEWDY